jgi:hypothetical protein
MCSIPLNGDTYILASTPTTSTQETMQFDPQYQEVTLPKPRLQASVYYFYPYTFTIQYTILFIKTRQFYFWGTYLWEVSIYSWLSCQLWTKALQGRRQEEKKSILSESV